MQYTYIVSGRPRSGTSMMMRTCIEGGIEGIYLSSSENQQSFNDAAKVSGYHPNPFGFYEGWKNVVDMDLRRTAGKVIKVIGRMLERLDIIDEITYRVVVMDRPYEEIETSFLRGFETTNGKMPEIWSIQKILSSVKDRSDIEIVHIKYHDVVFNPKQELQKLKDAGWPIDVDKAATIPTPELYRNRL